MDRSAEIDAFLAGLPDDLRTALETLRGQIATAAPDAVETIAYSVPAFRYRGRPLVSFSAGRNGRGPVRLLRPEPGAAWTPTGEALRDYRHEQGHHPLHAGPSHCRPSWSTMLVRARMAETDRKGKR